MNKKNGVIKEFNKELLGSFFIAFSIILILSLFNFNMGLIGKALNKLSFTLFGFAAYFMPIIFIIIGLILIRDRYNGYEIRYIYQSVLFLILIAILLDSKNININSFIDRIRVSKALSLKSKGGGILGGFFGYFIYKLFGKIGGFILIFTSFFVNLLIYMDLEFKDLKSYFKSLKLNLKNKIRLIMEKLKRKKEKPIIVDSTNIGPKEKKLDSKKIKNESTKEINYNKENTKGNKNIEDVKKTKEYTYPPLRLLKTPQKKDNIDSKKEIENKAKIIENTMDNFGINASISYINKGPTITCYELEPAPDVKLSKIVALSDNLALNLASPDIRIEAPIPGKSAVGIEVPNKIKSSVSLKEMLLTDEFKDIDSKIPLTLGKDVGGIPIISSIDKMPHLLIAGATGSGKSVCINTIIMSILYKSSPNETKLLLIDPKVVELSIYNNIPHLMIPVVTDPKEAALSLRWAVQEMERRYKLFAKTGSRNIKSYNEKIKDTNKRLANIVIIIDELADLMMVAAKEIEEYISRLAQMARAAGMHLILATQRPSVDVITGTIKANIPSRISFAVSSQVDSRTILDQGGAEKLLGMGDMLFYPSTYSKPIRVQGAFISDKEIEDVINFIVENNKSSYNEKVINKIENASKVDSLNSDPLTNDAIKLIVHSNNASISMLQRELNIGYNRARDIMEDLEKRKIVGGHEGSKARKVLVTKDQLNDIIL